MATGGVVGNGTKVGYSVSSPVTYTRIGQMQNIDQFISLVADKLDTTVYSTSNIMTAAPGMVPVPEFSFTLLADLDQSTTTSHETLRQYQAASGYSTQGTTIYFRIEVPVNRAMSSFRAWEFQGYVSEYTVSPPIKELQTIKITVVFSGTGVAVYNAGASVIS